MGPAVSRTWQATPAGRAEAAGRLRAELRGGGPTLHTPAGNAPGAADSGASGTSTGVPETSAGIPRTSTGARGTSTGTPGTSTGVPGTSARAAGTSARPGEPSGRGRISETESAAVLALVSAATEEDGVGPLSEHVMLHLRYGGDPRARNLLLYSQRELAGYAHLDPTDPVEGPSGELVIHPVHRGQGMGLELTRALVAEAGDQPLRLWAHGDLTAATRLATAAGFGRVRALWQMRRSLQARLGRPQLADDLTIRTFDVGRDEDQWLAVNSKAFSRHPEQGAWTRVDLDQREREPWFDPDGFFLAGRGGEVVGVH